MTDNFEQKLQNLNSKLQNMERPCSLIQRQSKCKDTFLNIRKSIAQKFQTLQNELKFVQEKVEKCQSQIQSTKLSINNFSCSKHSQLREIIQSWVDTFHYRLQNAKEGLISYEVATEVKLNQIEKDNEVLLSKLQDKIAKNIRKINNSMESIATKCQQERDYIKKEFEINKSNVKKLILEKERDQKEMQKAINQKMGEVQSKINSQIQLLSEKWSKKDEKTRKIFQLLVQDDM